MDHEAPFPSSFQAYTAHCRRIGEYQEQSRVPHLLMTLLPESKQDDRAMTSKCASLHCFERNANCNSNVQIARENDSTLKRKRRKLKNGKAKSLGDILEGLS